MDTHYLQFNKSKVNIPEPLKIGQNYHVSINGEIRGKNEDTNDDGSLDINWKLTPLTVEILKPTGEILIGDKRKRSQALRQRIFIAWKENHAPEDFDEYYEKQMNFIISHWEDLNSYAETNEKNTAQEIVG